MRSALCCLLLVVLARSAAADPDYARAAELYKLANQEMTDANFSDGSKVGATISPADAGTLQTFELDGLLPETDYWVGVRAFDDCRNPSTLAVVQLRTADRVSGEVDACFVATAAYGSMMANDVETLRAFRDTVLHTTVLGELAIETYYTFGPAAANVIGTSELLRTTARDVLQPIVAALRASRGTR